MEIYFSIVQRKVLRPNDFRSLAQLRDRPLRFQVHYDQAAKLFQWKFTRRDLDRLFSKLKERENGLSEAAVIRHT